VDANALHARTGGNPLFVAETVRALVDDGSLAVRRGRLELVADAGGSALPLTLRSLLGARIDALSRSGREVLGVAAVIGMTFGTDLVSELIGRSPRRSVFDGLVDAALIFPDGDGATWRFAHPLIRETAYAGLLSARRRALHAQLADRLESESRVPLARVARHRAAAGEPARAVPLLDAAAREALAVGATAEAAEFWRSAARLAGDADPRTAEFKRAAVAAQYRATTRGDDDGTAARGEDPWAPSGESVVSAGQPIEP
jgi:adenylate cyclase